MSLSRKKPAPFRRPSIDLGGPQRSWQHVPVAEVSVGDTVADFGSVSDVERWDDDRVKLTNAVGDYDYFFDNEVVFAFVSKVDN